ERVLDDIAIDEPATVIRNRISGFFADRERRADDIVAFYFTGHGGSIRHAHYLWPAGAQQTNPAGTAIATDEIARWFLEGTNKRPTNLLVILDVCSAG